MMINPRCEFCHTREHGPDGYCPVLHGGATPGAVPEAGESEAQAYASPGPGKTATKRVKLDPAPRRQRVATPTPKREAVAASPGPPTNAERCRRYRKKGGAWLREMNRLRMAENRERARQSVAE